MIVLAADALGALAKIARPSTANAPCETANGIVALVDKCSGVVTGAVANGKTCWGDEECIGGVCVSPDCGGTCMPYAVPGGPCVPTGGTPDVTCDPSVHYCADDGTCRAEFDYRPSSGSRVVIDNVICR